MRTLAISDHHFYHQSIIEYTNRPWPCDPDGVREMNRAMIAAWNEIVTDEDVIFHVGDFAFGDSSQQARILSQLRGAEKHLIMGNHDRSMAKCKEVGWTSVKRNHLYDHPDGYKVMLQHRPWLDDVPPLGIEVIVHGHIHNRVTRRAHININVSVEVLNYRPVDLDELVRQHMRVWGYERRRTA